ncbi:uncharacterized protein G2W53_009673 [Senna tora]|uniref:Uncharacterized protein n=1 Tax=Senna tora TaxID=362788 RepID=A0A834WYU0_9FABA|nr:uncharacterized protein G2W53_009673 [Senna tora]
MAKPNKSLSRDSRIFCPPPFAIANEAAFGNQPCYSRAITVNSSNSSPILPSSCVNDLAKLKDLIIQGLKARKDAIAAKEAGTHRKLENLRARWEERLILIKKNR